MPTPLIRRLMHSDAVLTLCAAPPVRLYTNRLRRLAVLPITLLLLGCAELPPTARDEGQAHWNTARAQVKARMASDQVDAGNLVAAERTIAEAQRLTPEDVELYALRARIWLASGRSVEALELLAKYPEEGPSAAVCAYLRGIIQQQQQRWELARDEYQRAVRGAPDEWSYLAALVQTQLQLRQPDAALAELHMQRDRFGWEAAWHAAVAECHEQRGDWQAAVGAWQQAAVNPAADREHTERLAEALCNAGRYAEAIPLLEGLSQADPTAPHLRLRLAEAYFGAGLFAAARPHLAVVLAQDRRHVAALRLLACCLAGDGDVAAGLATVEQALQTAPQDLRSLEVAVVLAWRSGADKPYGEYARRLRALRPDSPVVIRLEQLGD